LVVDPDGEPCRCEPDRRGCLETIASSQAILRRLAGETNVAAATLAEASAYVHHEEAVARVFSEAGQELGKVLASLVAVAGPSRLIVVGQPELVEEERFPSARSFMNGLSAGLSRRPLRTKVRSETRTLDDTLEPLAAASVAVHYFLNNPEAWLPTIAPEPQVVYMASQLSVEANPSTSRDEVAVVLTP
jgi:predicted NBD/HSP70 family sugar kinase